jgi:hypothetical protein
MVIYDHVSSNFFPRVSIKEGIKQGVVHGLTPTGILDSPPDLPTAAGELDMRIFPRSDPPIHLRQTALQVLFEHGKLLLSARVRHILAGSYLPMLLVFAACQAIRAGMSP